MPSGFKLVFQNATVTLVDLWPNQGDSLEKLLYFEKTIGLHYNI